MKSSFKKIAPVCFAAVLLFCQAMVPFIVFAAPGVIPIDLTSGSIVIASDGTYTVGGLPAESWVSGDSFHITGNNITTTNTIYVEDGITVPFEIELDGVNISYTNTTPISIGDSSAQLTLKLTGNNLLTGLSAVGLSSSMPGVIVGTGKLQVTDSSQNSILWEKNLTVNSGTIETVTSNIGAFPGSIYVAGSLIINGGSVSGKAVNAASSGGVLVGTSLFVTGGRLVGEGTTTGIGVLSGGGAVITGGTVNATARGSATLGISAGIFAAAGDIVISGGNVKAFADGSVSVKADLAPAVGSGVEILGGNIEASSMAQISYGSPPSATPIEPTSDGTTRVYPQTIATGKNNSAVVAADVPSVNTTPSEGTSSAYGIKDVVGDATGNVYFYLPYSTSIGISHTAVSLSQGATHALAVTFMAPETAWQRVTYTSDNSSVASVNSAGVITAGSVGTATITVTAADGSGVVATCVVTVTAPAASSSTPSSSSSNAPAVTSYRVMYDVNYGNLGTTLIDDQTGYLSGAVVLLRNTVPTRAGYAFTAWNTAPNGRGASYAPGAAFTISTDTRLYAQWKTKDGSSQGAISVSSFAPSSSQASSQISTAPSSSGINSSSSSQALSSASSLSQPGNGGTTASENWALLNLLFAIVGVLAAITLIGMAAAGKAKGKLWVAFASVAAVISLVFVLFTSSFFSAMVVVNKWTILVAVLALLETLFIVLALKGKSSSFEDFEE